MGFQGKQNFVDFPEVKLGSPDFFIGMAGGCKKGLCCRKRKGNKKGEAGEAWESQRMLKMAKKRGIYGCWLQ